MAQTKLKKKFHLKQMLSYTFVATVSVVGITATVVSCGGGGDDSTSSTPAGGGVSYVANPAPIGGMLTQHGDLSRTGQNLNETILTPQNVNSANFGKVAALPVDGLVYAQPLVVNGVTVGAKALNLVIVATENDSVYAYDVTGGASGLFNSPHPTPVWQSHFLASCSSYPEAPSSCTTANPVDVNAPNVSPAVGITATPVIDPVTQTIYVTAMTKEILAGSAAPQFYWRLHALSLIDGSERPGSPIVITATYPGAGYGAVTPSGETCPTPTNATSNPNNCTITFSPVNQLSRAGLVFNNGVVQIAFTSFDDNEPTHGWVFAYKGVGYNGNPTNSAQCVAGANGQCQLSTLSSNPVGVWMSTPNTGDGTIWQAGGAPAMDAAGNLYFATGNGDPNTTFADFANPPDFADSVIKLTLGNNGLGNASNPNSAYTVSDSFTPYNHAKLAEGDVDLGSGGVLLIPTAQSGVNLLIAGGKQGSIYVMNQQKLGGFSTTLQSEEASIVQELVSDIAGGKNYGPGIYGTMSYYGANNTVYVIPNAQDLTAIPVVNGQLSWSQHTSSGVVLKQRGAMATITDSPTGGNGIVWYIDPSAYTYTWVNGMVPPTLSNGSAVLYAFDADPSKWSNGPLYSSPANVVATPSANGNITADVCAQSGSSAAGCAVKFSVPTVYNGMVFVGTQTEVSVYGLFGQVVSANEARQRNAKVETTTSGSPSRALTREQLEIRQEIVSKQFTHLQELGGDIFSGASGAEPLVPMN